MFKITSTLPLMAICMVLGFTSCTKKTDNTTTNGGKHYAYVQFINAAPSEQICDFYDLHSTNSAVTPGAYYTLATSYLKTLTTDATFHIEDYDTSAHAVRTVLTTPALAPDSNKSYTFIIYDTFPNLKYLFTKDTVHALTDAAAGQGWVKFINASPNAGTVSYRLKGTSTILASATSAATSANTSASSFVAVPVGYQDVELVDASNNVIDSMGQFVWSVEQGKSYTIYTGGYKGGTGNNNIKTFVTYDEVVP